MLRKFTLFLALAILFTSINTFATNISIIETKENTNYTIIATNFTPPVNLVIQRNNMILLNKTNKSGIFNVDINDICNNSLPEFLTWGSLDVIIEDSNGKQATSSIYFDDKTSSAEEIYFPTPSPSPQPQSEYLIYSRLEFTIGSKQIKRFIIDERWLKEKNLSGADIIREKETTKTNMDVPPLFNDRGDRVLIPVRFFAESVGYNVEWNANSRSVIITSPEQEVVSMQIGSTYICKKTSNNGIEIIDIDEPLQIQNNRTYLPVRFVGEAFGYDVTWDALLKRAILKK